MRIIVAIDIIDGKCVRLTKGDFSSSKIYNEDPLEVAKKIEDNGIKFLHLVDLDGARTSRIVNHKILRTITGKTSLKVDFGGGIRSSEDIKTAFEYGASQVICGSTAVYRPDKFVEWLSLYGPDRIILGADTVSNKVSTSGWLQNSDQDIVKFIKDYFNKGVRYTICTDIEKDGMLQGPSIHLYKNILNEVKINLIASGGITTKRDITELQEAGCEGAIIGKAVYERRLTLKELGKLC